jgi:hypothetical protein
MTIEEGGWSRAVRANPILDLLSSFCTTGSSLRGAALRTVVAPRGNREFAPN